MCSFRSDSEKFTERTSNFRRGRTRDGKYQQYDEELPVIINSPSSLQFFHTANIRFCLKNQIRVGTLNR